MNFKVEYETVIRGHHVYKCVWTPLMNEKLECNKDTRAKAKEHDENAIGVYRVTKQLDAANENKDACWSLSDRIVAFDEVLSRSQHGKQTCSTSFWKEEERNWPCCSSKIL